MSRKGMFLILLGFLVLCVGMGAKSFIGFDFSHMSEVLWGLFILFVGTGIILEKSFLFEFITMKTTKHGMNMGTAILLVMVLLIAVNYISVVHDKKWDLTKEKSNSLSEQTIQIVRGLDKKLEIIGFFKDGEQEIQQTKNVFMDVVEKMKFENPKIQYEIYDPDKRPDLKQKYAVSALGDVVILYDGKQKLVSIINMLQPEQAEETLVNNIFVLSSNNGKAIYFLTGHNETDIDSQARDGLSYLKKSLTDLNYEIKTINLAQTEKIPDDAKMILIIDPKTPLYDGEIKILKDYAKNGGRILVASQPGEKNNIDKLADVFGVDFMNDYIIDFAGMRVGGSQYLAIGLVYPPGKSNITKGFKANTNFNIASEVLYHTVTGINHDTLVESSPQSIVRQHLVEQIQLDPKKDIPRSKSIAVLAEGKIGNSTKDFKAIFFGNSTFMTNNDVQVSILNRDLILNSIAYLADQKNLISLRPKKVKLSAFFITPTESMFTLYGFGLIPLICLVMSILLWYRRRLA